MLEHHQHFCPFYPPTPKKKKSDWQWSSVSHTFVSAGKVRLFALFLVKTSCVQRSHEMYQWTPLDIISHLLTDLVMNWRQHSHKRQKSLSFQSWVPKHYINVYFHVRLYMKLYVRVMSPRYLSFCWLKWASGYGIYSARLYSDLYS